MHCFLASCAGRPLNLTVNATAKHKLSPTFPSPPPHSTMLSMQTKLGFSNKQTLSVASMLREGVGSRKAVEPNLAQKLISEGRKLMGHFSFKTFNVTVKSDEGGKATAARKPVVICNNISHFVSEVARHRPDLRNDSLPMYTLGIDGGSGFLKVCLNIIHMTDREQEHLTKSPVMKRQSLSGSILDSGVKKLFILAVSPEVPESYNNVKSLLSLLDISSLSFTLSWDMKLSNILIGSQNHASKFPCAYCEACAPFESSGRIRTIG